MAAVMTGDGRRLVLGELKAVRQTHAARERFRVDRLMELRAVIDSLRWEADVDPDSPRPAPPPVEFRRMP